MLVFVPLGLDELRALRADGLTDVAAHATTPVLFEALGYDEKMAEDAEFAALTYASVDALTRHAHRLVAVAEVQDSALTRLDDPEGFGLVRVATLRWQQVTSLFAGDPEDAAQESEAAAAAGGRDLADAWEDPAVSAMVESTDLCWFAPDEADDLARALA